MSSKSMKPSLSSLAKEQSALSSRKINVIRSRIAEEYFIIP
ncbi:MAG TPA: hypothetical protein VI278_04185 [Nitrososphaeraceae archaeon]